MKIFGADNGQSHLEKNFLEKGLVPQFVVQDWLDKCEPELQAGVENDYDILRDYFFDGKTSAPKNEQKLYLATAGAPCVAKSTELDIEIIKGTDPRYKNLIIVDPDRYGMEYMLTYRGMLRAYDKAKLGFAEAARIAYDRARPGSNIITLLMLNKAYNAGFHIAHGTTMTGGAVGGLLESLGNKGYERRLLLCYAPDNVRIEAGNRRITSECHYQVDPTDFVSKGEAFPQRHDVYFSKGDDLRLLWKSAVEERSAFAALYVGGNRIIVNQSAYNDYRAQYAEHAAALKTNKGIELPKWESLEALYFSRFERKLGV